MKLTASEIARLAEGSLRGDSALHISGAAQLDKAGPSDLSFLADPALAAAASGSKAGCLLVPTGSDEQFKDFTGTLIFTKNPKYAFMLALRLVEKEKRPLPAPGVHPTACVSALALLGKDVHIGPLAVIALFLVLVRERDVAARFVPWAGVALFLAVALPWYLLVEWSNRGFLWYTVVDNHVLNFTRSRVFPDEDVPLSALEFVGVTAAGFFPWCLALPWAVWRGLRDPRDNPWARPWLLLALWTVVVLGFFTLSPFKLPHYGLPAFPAMALLVAKLWEDVLDRAPGAPSPPSGPPRGTNFSRRKLRQPRPPSPAATWMSTSSTNN